MKRKIYLALILVVIVICAFSFSGCTVIPSSSIDLEKALKEGNYQLVFEDDFNGTELNKNIWQTYQEGDVRRGAYMDDNLAFVDGNGNAVIRTQYIDSGDKQGWHTSWLQSASYGRNDNGGFAAQYGYFEARLIAPPCNGIWSAFWLMPDVADCPWDGKTADNGAEIDIMESAWYDSKTTDGCAQFVVHTNYSGITGKLAKGIYKIRKMHSEYHTFGVMWTPTNYTWFIDGYKVLTTQHKINGKVTTPMVNEYMVLSVEVGGDINDKTGKPVSGNCWAGNPNSNDKTKNYDFVIDYVKVYQMKAN